MARADIVTLISLDSFAKFLQIDPLHFNSVESQRRPLRNDCDDVFFQHDWQYVGRTSRETVAMALKQAEARVMAVLGYPLKAMWVVAEDQQVEKVAFVDMAGVGSVNVRGQLKSVRANWGHVIAAGRRALELIDDGAAVVYTDEDGDGYKETATVSTITALTADPEEISTYYPGKDGSPAWEIRPTRVAISGGVVTIVFRREQAVLESLLERETDLTDSTPVVDGDNDANFLTTVDVYREYNDPSQQVTFYSEGSCSSCGGSGCAACGYEVETGCLGIRDPRLGILTYNRADWDEDTESYIATGFTQGREPDRMQIWYRAGWQDKTLAFPLRTMDPVWERMVAYYAMTLIDSQLPGCSNTRSITEYYQYDLAANRAVGNDASSNQISEEDLGNPLGTTRAAMHLWKYIKTNSGRLVTAR